MARPRTPTTVLKLRGAFKEHPKREKEREGEPEVREPLGDPPDTFDESLTARWVEVSTWCPWLTIADRPAVEATCRLWTKMRNNDMKGGDWATLLGYLCRLGMVPTERSKVKVPGKKPKANPFGELTG